MTQLATHQCPSGRPAGRPGAMVLEAFVALTLLTTVFSVVLPLVVRHDRLLADYRDYRLALDELSNQLDRLSALPADELIASLRQLQPSKLTSDLDAADISLRLTLRISWGEPRQQSWPRSAREKAGTREETGRVTSSKPRAAPRRVAQLGRSDRTSRRLPPIPIRQVTLVTWVFPVPPAKIEPAQPEESP